MSLAIYVFAFVIPYNLLQYWEQPGLTIAKIAQGDGFAGIMYVSTFTALYVIYVLAAYLVRQHQNRTTGYIIIVSAIAFNLTMLFLYPVDSNDIFDNIIRGRIQSIYHANPFYDTPVQFLDDPFHPYIAWDHVPSAYGPGWEAIAAISTWLSGDSILTNVFALKCVSVIAYAGTSIVIALTLRILAPERVLFGVTLLAWNPLAIYVIAGNGHNDAVMVFFLMLGFYFFVRKNFALTVLAEMIGVIIKFIPLFIVPAIVVASIRNLPDTQSRARFVLIITIACVIIALAAYVPYWHGGDILGLTWRANNFTTSLPALIQSSLAPPWGKAETNQLVSWTATIVLAIWILRELWSLWQHNDIDSVIRTSFSILAFYLLVTCLWVQSWYALWLIPFIALLRDKTLVLGALLITFFFTMKMPLFDFVMNVNDHNLIPRNVREWQITLGTLGPIWMYFIGIFLKHRVLVR